MPRMNLNTSHVAHDPDEGALLDLARASRFHVRLNNVARKAGGPSIELYRTGDKVTCVARFRRAAQAIAFIEGGGAK